MMNNKRSLSGPTMTIASINIKGISQKKKLYQRNSVKMLNVTFCAHKKHTEITPKINGMKLFNIIHHKKTWSAMFVNITIAIKSRQIHGAGDMEILMIDLGTISI